MKIIKSLIVLAIVGFVFISCQKNNQKTTTNEVTETDIPKVQAKIVAENLQTANFTIEGMTCAMGCAKTIEKELTQLNGVQEAKVDFDNKTATVTFDKTVQTPESLTTVVQKTGDGKTYKVKNMKS